MATRTLTTIGTLLLSAFLLFSTVGCKLKKPGNKGSAASVSTMKVGVKTGTVVRRTLVDKRVFTGVLEPLRKADLAPLMGGKVKTIRVEIGDRVAKGQVLAQMDDGALVALIAQFQPLKSQYDRSQRLYANKAMTKVQFEGIEAQYFATKRQVDQLDENTTIRAPFAGVITDKTAEDGEVFSPQMNMGKPGRSAGLLQLTQLDPLKVDLDVDEMTVARIKKGMPVNLTVSALPESSEVVGKVEYVNPAANSLSRTFGVRIAVPNHRGTLKAGYFVEAGIAIGEKKDVLTLPSSAVVNGQVFVVTDSLAVAVPVKVGYMGPDAVEILSGVSEGAVVVVEGNKALPDSSLVEVRN